MLRAKIRGWPAILPAGASQFLDRRRMEAVGFALVAAGVGLGLALVSYYPSDPSFNTATGGPVRNLLGVPGARAADLLLQTVGWASAFIPLALLLWGARLVAKRRTARSWLRIPALIAAVVLVSTGLSILATPIGWSPNGRLGGAFGSLLLVEIGGLAGPYLSGFGEGVVALSAITLGLGAMPYALGLAVSDWLMAFRVFLRGIAVFARGITWSRDTALAGVAKWRDRERREPRLDGPADEPDDETEDESKDDSEEDTTTLRAVIQPRPPKAKPGRRAKAERQGRLALDKSDAFRLPPLDLLLEATPENGARVASPDALEQNARLLESVLADFGVRGEISAVRPGPVVTLYEFEPAPGIKISRVIGLAYDIARSMSAVSVRIAVIPGRNVIGMELPNLRREVVRLRELLGAESFERAAGAGRLALPLGKDIGGTAVLADLARMPHMLIAGTTGSGKSVAINTMILSLLYQLTPDDCRFIMIDPKMLELSVYEGIPHLLCPVVTEPGKAVMALKWTVREMEDRYRTMSYLGVRNVAGYNARIEEAVKKGETLSRRVQTGFEEQTGKPIFEDQTLPMKPLPLIVVIVDEMADLMLLAGKDIEAAVQRLAQMARAAGIHLIMATQRPSVDVITGTIKANFPTRVSFQVTSKIDSRTILGEQGAEQLLGHGDMLYMAPGGRLTRVHGPLVTDAEVERVVEHLRASGEPDYIESVTEGDDDTVMQTFGGGEDGDLYGQAVALVRRERKASTSFIQRHLQIGYNRAARLIEQMEAEGIVSRSDRVGRREVLGLD